MARGSDWAVKVQALIKAGNIDAAIAQIKVAPTVKDLKALQTGLAQTGITELKPSSRMPVLFVGHGSPMNDS